MSTRKTSENWSSRLGVIMAVAGSAVGLGNFLRFPGQAAQYGGGAFMIAYFISLLIIGVSICWAEWTLGRWGGRYGFHSSPGIFGALLRHPAARYVGIIGVIIPCGVYMYYVYIEAWCLGYAVQFLTGHLGSPEVDYPAHFAHFVGMNQDGFAIGLGLTQVGLFVIAVYALNFYLIYRGLSRGIEMFCKFAMPALIAIALVIVVRVLTLGTPNPEFPERNVLNGLGFMWNPGNVGEQLANPQLWLAAAGQIFFSLSVGFGVILTYASYLTDRDDIVLSGLTATSANEFCEVGLGGLMTLPAAFIYLGSAGVAGGTFGLGFNVLPIVFANMPFGQVFGFLFFLLLFLAAVTSSLSMLQPGIAFLEEALGIGRRMSVTLLGMMTVTGTMFVWYYSKDLKALDTIDFWVGTFLIFVQGTILVIVFAWIIGTEKGFAEAHKGSTMRIPRVFGLVMKYLCPAFLLGIFFMWLGVNVLGWNASFSDPQFNPTGYTLDLVGSEEHPPSAVARLSVGMIVVMALFIGIITHLAGRRWNAQSSTRGGAQ